MVTNLPENAKAQWKRVVAARTPQEKLRELQKFYAMIPKHKGTKNLVKYIRRKISVLKEEIEESKRKCRGARYISSWEQKVQGVARLAIVGFDVNAQRELFEILSGRKLETYFVYEPVYGILEEFGVQFQLALLPSVERDSKLSDRVFSYLQTSKLVFFASTSENFKDFDYFREIAESEGIILRKIEGEVCIEKTVSGGIRVVGSVTDASNEDIIRLLQSYGIRNAIVKLIGKVSIDDVENEILGIKRYIQCLPLRKCNSHLLLKEGDHILKFESKKELISFILRKLSLIRIYTKTHGGPVSEKPFVIKEGATVEDLAREIHSRLVKYFRYAIVWRNGKSIRVSKNFVLQDGDIVEIRAY